VDDAGGAVVEILETKAFSTVTKADLDSWIQAYNLPVTSMRDPDNMPSGTYDALGIRETVFIVQLSDMKILTVINGSTAGVQPNAVRQAIPMILALLGNKSG